MSFEFISFFSFFSCVCVALLTISKKISFEMRTSTTFAVVSLIAALLLSIATRATGSTNNDRVVKTSKSRAARIDLNVLFSDWCNLNPSVEHASPSASVPASCEVYLMNEPSRGELFDVSTAGVEIHSNSSQYYPYTQSNRWTYAEETYVGDGSDGNDDDEYEHTSNKELSASVEFRSGSKYDHFSVGIFSPRGAPAPNASGVIVMHVINHKPQAISSTLILRRTQPWSMADETSKNSTEYFFPRRQLLQAVDSDTTETHTTELTEISNIKIDWYAGSKETLMPTFVNSLGNAASSIVQDGEESSAYDPIFLSINTTVTAQPSLMVHYNAVDSENATSLVGTTYISVLEHGSSKLPEAPLHARQAPSDYVVDRLFGLPSVVLCKYMVGGATFSDCNFVLMGGDILAAQVSMGVISGCHTL
ncbi:membrane-associated protein, putative [Bodo saltans]|uniref:Membrane-associated protein, putative n=1 Tax=Bodo saltans TaxID=75058 RepID=A0A0S4JQI1_BODSA|nr:membrane-associated protein, putative [Bodo saltans]|eukprot:CUG90772.1 membrane-associated protein, putative [Bodo saltans]